MKKVLALLFIGSIAIAAALVFSGKFLFLKGKDKAAAYMKGKVEQVAAQISTQTVTEPVAPPESEGVKKVRLVMSEDAAERKAGIAGLAALPQPDPEAADMLAGGLAISSATIVPDVLAGLAALAPKNPEALNTLIQSLKDRNTKVTAINELARLGPVAAPAIPALKTISANPKERKSIRAAANAALRKIQPPAKKKAGKKKNVRKGSGKKKKA